MAVSNVQQLSPPATGSSSPRTFFSLALRRPVEIWKLDKGGGDTTYTLQSAGFKRITKVTVYDDSFAVIAAAAGSVGASSTDLSALGGGTRCYVVLEGARH